MDIIGLSKTALFRGATPQKVEAMLSCLGAEARQFSKGEMIYRMGDVVASPGCAPAPVAAAASPSAICAPSLPQRTGTSPKKLFTPPPSLSAGGCCPICPIRPCAAGAAALLSPFTASRWPTTPIWTAARCQMN